VNIVVFKLSPLGDTVMFLPVVQTLRRLQPGWRVTVLATPATAALFRETVSPTDLVVCERPELQKCWRRPWRLLAWWWRLRRWRPDAVLLSFDQSSMARILAATSGARIRVGGAGAVIRCQAGLTHTIEKAAGHTLAEWDWAMAGVMMQSLGQDWPASPPPPVLPVPEASRSAAQRPRVVVHAGASREYQRWLPERFAELATALAGDCDVVWIENSDVPAPHGVRTVSSRTLDELLRIIADSDLFVGNHSGPFHLATALGRPCVVPTGPTSPECDPPWHRDRLSLLRAPGLACLPCDHLMRAANQCQNLASPMACMKHWSVETVVAVCRDRLKRGIAPGTSYL
jgi:ADP-heptose:LPS heptosyltransferase